MLAALLKEVSSKCPPEDSSVEVAHPLTDGLLTVRQDSGPADPGLSVWPVAGQCVELRCVSLMSICSLARHSSTCKVQILGLAPRQSTCLLPHLLSAV